MQLHCVGCLSTFLDLRNVVLWNVDKQIYLEGVHEENGQCPDYWCIFQKNWCKLKNSWPLLKTARKLTNLFFVTLDVYMKPHVAHTIVLQLVAFSATLVANPCIIMQSMCESRVIKSSFKLTSTWQSFEGYTYNKV